MKKLIFILSCFLLTSCTTYRQVAIEENKLFITRKYIGNYLDYREVKGLKWSDSNIFFIKTTHEEIYGKIPVKKRGKICRFEKGDPLYVKRYSHSLPGNTVRQYTYQLESSNGKTFYVLSSFEYGRKILDFTNMVE